MRAYGSLSHDTVNHRGENYAPSSKVADLSAAHRRATRRTFNHKTRRTLAADLRREVKDD